MASFYLVSVTTEAKRNKLGALEIQRRIKLLQAYAKTLKGRCGQRLLDKLNVADLKGHIIEEADATRSHVTTEIGDVKQSLNRIEAKLGIPPASASSGSVAAVPNVAEV